MPAYKFPEGQVPSVADFAVGGPLSAVGSKIGGLVKVIGKSGAVGFKRHPAVKALLDLFKEGQVNVASNVRPLPEAGQFRVPATTPIRVPKGFTLPKSLRNSPPRQHTTKFGLKAEERKQARFYKQFKPETFSAKLSKEPSPPSVRGLDELKDIYLSTRSTASSTPPKPLLRAVTSGSKRARNAKLTEEKVRAIRMDLKNLTPEKVAEKLGLNKETIASIARGDTWYWVK